MGSFNFGSGRFRLKREKEFVCGSQNFVRSFSAAHWPVFKNDFRWFEKFCDRLTPGLRKWEMEIVFWFLLLHSGAII